MPVDNAPQWLRDLQRDELISEHHHHQLLLARERHAFRHREAAQRHGESQLERLDWSIIADEVAYANAVIGHVTPAEWQALTEWHRGAAHRRSQIPHILSMISSCSSCMTRIGESEVVAREGDPELAEAVAAVVTLAARFKGGQRRHFLRMLEEAGNSGLTTTITVSVNGEPSAEQEGVRAGSRDGPSRADRHG